jgi:hypothetical protein
MPKKSISMGIIVEYPDGFRLVERGDELEGGLRAASAVEGESRDGLLMDAVSALPDFESIAILEIQGAVGKERLAAMEGSQQGEQVTIRVPIQAGESVVLLSECDGMVRWEYPDAIETQADETSGGLGAQASETQRFAVFSSPYPLAPDPDKKPESLGFVGEFLLAPLKKQVLRFTAYKAAQALGEFLERNVQEGPIVLGRDGAGRLAWLPAESFTQVLAGKSTKRVLLFVHGTFSSTEGSFGSLLSTTAGEALLTRALEHYDAVIGFDHKTLTKSVEQNARELLAALDTLPGKIRFDAVAFSRGGLVLRYLSEVIKQDLPLEKVVFVGCTNAGTLLAHPDHWKAWVDLHTNLVTAAGYVAALAGGPAVAAAAKTLSSAVRGLLSFVKYLASESVDGRAIPGLASMGPDGSIVRLLNQDNTRKAPPQAPGYYIVEADFDHTFFDDQGLRTKGLTKRLCLYIADTFIDQLFNKCTNDLVVNSDSMSQLPHWALPDGIKARQSFAKGDGVYHTVYFNDPQATRLLAIWLLGAD